MHVMPFNSLLLVSLIADTHFSESGVEVRMKQEAGEKVLFFKMDQKAVRDSLRIDGHICDGLVFYCRGNEKTCCFVELKGSKLDTAVKQVINTCDRLKQEIKNSLGRMECQSLLTKISWKAYICLGSGVPRDLQDHRGRLEATFGKDNYSIQTKGDLGLFLRGEARKHTKPSKRWH
jgi:hypothetical protein